ncbi:MAG: hypothetical protein Q9218_007187 [Villophora microphyllina]
MAGSLAGKTAIVTGAGSASKVSISLSPASSCANNATSSSPISPSALKPKKSSKPTHPPHAPLPAPFSKRPMYENGRNWRKCSIPPTKSLEV